MRVLYLVAFLMAIKVSAQDQKFNADKFNGTIENQIVLLDLNESQKIQFKELNDKYLIKLELIKFLKSSKVNSILIIITCFFNSSSESTNMKEARPFIVKLFRHLATF